MQFWSKVRKIHWNYFLFDCVSPGINILLFHLYSLAHYELPVKSSSRVDGTYANLVFQIDGTVTGGSLSLLAVCSRHETTFLTPRSVA
jgi:hypothetical protein